MSTSIDYTSRDYDGLRASLLAYAQQAFPDWSPGSEGDFGVLLLELLAYVGDVNSYYVDRAQNEAYLNTATQRSSLLNIAKILGYTPGTGQPATGTVTLTTTVPGGVGTNSTPAVVVPAGTQLATDYIAAIDGQIIFETNTEVTVPGNGGTISVGVTEGETLSTLGQPTQIAASDGTPDQTYRIPTPLVYVNSVEVYVAGVQWLVVDHLLDYGATDSVVELYTDENNYTWLQFGDNINGAIPGVGLAISVIYRVGYGSQGNLPAGSITQFVDTSVTGVSIQMSSTDSTKSTSSATTGGADPDTNDQIRNNAPKTFFTQDRCVTVDDFTNLALSVPGVSKANTVATYFSSVVVFILGPDGGAATSTLQNAVSTALADKVLAGVSVTVGTPTAVTIKLHSTSSDWPSIEVWPTYSQATVSYNVQQAITNYFSYTSIDIGQKITVSDLYKTIMAVDGVRYASVPMLYRSDATAGNSDIQLQSWEYPVIESGLTIIATGGM